jgi:hypothetical protein
VAACLARRHVARAAWANDGKGVPPSPKPACFLAGDAIDGRQPKWAMPPMPTPAGATQEWFFLTIFFIGDLFYHFIGADGPICQKFSPLRL